MRIFLQHDCGGFRADACVYPVLKRLTSKAEKLQAIQFEGEQRPRSFDSMRLQNKTRVAEEIAAGGASPVCFDLPNPCAQLKDCGKQGAAR